MRTSKQKRSATCSCGWTGEIRNDTYNNNIKKNGTYTCHKCATIKAGKNGKYSGNAAQRSLQSKKLWKNQKFRSKITAASTTANNVQEYKQQQSNRTKILWNNTSYRSLVSSSVKLAMCDPLVKERISNGLRKRWEDEIYRKTIITNLGRQKVSSLQTTLYQYLTDLNVNFKKEGQETIIGFYSFDCLIPNTPRSILIECQGDYWHSLPKAIRNDRSKFSYINKYFPEYEIMYIWEHEFATKDRVLDRLKQKLKLPIETISFKLSDTISSVLDRSKANEFLSRYHYLTSSRGGQDYGLWLGDVLIAVSRFGPLPRQNMSHQFPTGAVELARLCVHPNYHKKNLLSWWLSKLVKNYPAVVAFSDTTVGHTGATYKATNFKLHHTTDPDFWYVDKDGFVMHKKTLYNRAINLKMTEAEYADRYGYVKKWGGPKLCFIYNR